MTVLQYVHFRQRHAHFLKLLALREWALCLGMTTTVHNLETMIAEAITC